MSNSRPAPEQFAGKPPFNIHDAMDGDKTPFYGQEALVDTIVKNAGDQARILDFRSSSGQWANVVARWYSKARVVALDDRDPVPRDPEDPYPSNIEFKKVGSIDSNSISEVDGKFDVIHARAASATVTDFSKVITDAVGRLRPGGIILLTSGDLDIYKDDAVVETEPKIAMQQLLHGIHRIQTDKGMDMDSKGRWGDILTNASKLLRVTQTKIKLTMTKDDKDKYTLQFMQDTLNHFGKDILGDDLFSQAQAELNGDTLTDKHLRWPFAWAVMAA